MAQLLGVRHIVRLISIIVALGLILLSAGCSGPKQPVSFYLSNQGPTSGGNSIPTNTAALVVTRLRSVYADFTGRTVSISFFQPDADVIEKLTADNIGKTMAVVQGTNVLDVGPIAAVVPPNASLMFRVNTNLDFQSVYRELLKLSP